MNIILKFISFLFVFSFFACQPEKVDQKRIRVAIPKFQADKAYDYIARQVSFGPRVPGTKAHKECKDWLADELKDLGFKVSLQNFNAKSLNGSSVKGTNIIGSYNPKVKERILLCAHWDTRGEADKDTVRINEPIDGADDGASGVGVLLEIARLINERPIPMGVDIVFFDLEDQGQSNGDTYSWCQGSQYWAKNLDVGYQVKYGILLDMVGAKGAHFPVEGMSMAVARQLVQKIWLLGQGMGRENFFRISRTPQIIDDHRFIFEITAIPVIDIINISDNAEFPSHHHTHRDNMDIISRNTLDAVGQLVTAVIYRESNMEF